MTTAKTPQEKRPLVVLGTGAYALACLDVADVWNHPQYRLAGFSQNLDPSRENETFEGYPVYRLDDLAPLASTHHAICFISDATAKRAFVEQAKALNFDFANFIGKDACLGKSCEVGEGLFLGRGSVVCSHTSIGDHFTSMGKVMIGESCHIGDDVFIGSGSLLGGSIRVGSRTFIGQGAMIRDHLTIGQDVTVAMGAVVVRDVPSGVTVVGNPAREITPRKQI